MAKRLDIRPLAYVDLAEISEYIAKDRPGSARRFVLAAEKTIDWLLKNPDAGVACEFEHPLARDLRLWRVKGFKNYLIFYRPTKTGIQVVRVLHGARDIDSIFGAGGGQTAE
jgi:toxin ParE1/3/4